ncbi:MAG: CHAT domain-containing protein [Blastocatellia bacterium]|nr:CHAT domain-containing protein [Blastocatellia bacterium]
MPYFLAQLMVLAWFRQDWELTFVWGLVLSISVPVHSQSAPSVTPVTLETGKIVEQTISNDEIQVFVTTLKAGQWTRIVVERQGFDYVVRVLAPDGTLCLEKKSLDGVSAADPLFILAVVDGTYRLEVKLGQPRKNPVRYRLRQMEVRAAEVADQTRLKAQSLLVEAEALRFKQSAEAGKLAVAKYEEARPLFHETGEKTLEADTVRGLARAMALRGNPDLTVLEALMKENVSLRREAQDRRAEMAALNDVARIHRGRREPDKALTVIGEALTLAEQTDDKAMQAELLTFRGLVKSDLDQRRAALADYLAALPLAQKAGNSRQEGILLNNLGNTYNELGEPQKAIDYLVQSLTFRKAANDLNGEFASLLNLGVTYSNLGDYCRAEDYYKQALNVARSKGDRSGEVDMLTFLGSASIYLRQPQIAIELLEQAIGLTEQFKLQKSEESHIFLASALAHLGKGAEALAIYQKILPDLRRKEAFTLLLRCFPGMGIIYRQQGEVQKAFDTYAEMQAIAVKIEDDLAASAALYEMARLERAQGKLTAAQTHIEQAIAIAEMRRARVADVRLRTTFFASVRRYYESYIDILMQLHQQNPTAGFDLQALQVSERARARSLVELLQTAQADIREGVDPALLERERDVTAALNLKHQRLTTFVVGHRPAEEISKLKQEINALLAESEQLATEIRRNNPRYAALVRPPAISVKEIQEQVLDAKTVLLEYALGEDQSYVWVVSATAVKSYSLPSRGRLETLARKAHQALKTPQKELRNLQKLPEPGLPPERLAEAGRAEMAELSRLILAPALSELGRNRVLIAADGALHFIPFAALPVVSVLNPSQETSVPFMAEREIVMIPSAASLLVLRQERHSQPPATQKQLLVLADPVFSSEDKRVLTQGVKESKPVDSQLAGLVAERKRALFRPEVEGNAENRNLTLIPRLPGTRQEALALQKLTPASACTLWLDFAAGRETVEQQDLQSYRMIHFATHGFLNSQNPELSGLVLSLVDRQGNERNGFLLVSDIFNLKLRADLVTLSACETGLGEEIQGEGLVGLTRAFMYAGTSRVVVSLWSVNDQATAEFMKMFYTGMLKNGLAPAAALRKAQLTLRQHPKWKDPFYWAAFQLQGDYR